MEGRCGSLLWPILLWTMCSLGGKHEYFFQNCINLSVLVLVRVIICLHFFWSVNSLNISNGNSLHSNFKPLLIKGLLSRFSGLRIIFQVLFFTDARDKETHISCT